MVLGRVFAWSSPVTLSVALSFPLPVESAQPAKAPASRKSEQAGDPFLAAQTQIARLRQTADQLRLLANQPLPVNAKGEAREELLKHEAWLRQAGHRVHVLASEWEQQVNPAAASKTTASATDMNAFFKSQSAALQSKLQHESLQLDMRSTATRSAGETARIVIAKMN